MKISELNKPSSVSYRKKQKENPICSNCDRLKTKHTDVQRENCTRAIYFKA